MTVEFTKRFILSNFSSLGEKPDFRTADQMNQAARSGKQNIIEGVGQSRTSKKGEIKLLGVANASLEELLADFEDFLRQRKLKIFPKTHYKIQNFRKIAFRLTALSNLSHLGNLKEKPNLPKSPEEAGNFLLTLCHQVTYLLSKQIKSLEEKFIKDGGYSENLFKKRLNSKI
ncbi:MAG: four helix bundle suffix domain-containing protein [Patescibacteria group bacterium]|nr:four helix bundle suffix domain-containing protein [Patescibacteria group bacterium]